MAWIPPAEGDSLSRSRTVWALVCLGLFGLGVLLNFPLFQPGEHIYRDSIEGGYAGMTRFFAEHPDPWAWNPLQYGGLPAQFTYLPLLPYLGALLSWITGIAPEYAYRLVSATLVCLGPVTLFVLVRYFTGSARWALATALLYTFFSPCYGLIRVIKADQGLFYLPWRLHVFLKYGEGPHNAGLTLLPLALVALDRAARNIGFRYIFPAAVLLGAITLTNWVAALATAIAVLMLALAAWGDPRFSYFRVAVTGVLGYLLVSFWLTPTFVSTIAFNWPADAFNYKLQQSQTWLLAALLALLLALRVSFRWIAAGSYARWIVLCGAAFGWMVIIFYSYGLDPIPESRRYAIEFEMFLILALAEFARTSLRSSNAVTWITALVPLALVLVTGHGQVTHYLTQGWAGWAPFPREQSVEYQVAQWLAAQHPQGRILASGGLRFRLNSWFALQQVGGTFETGVRNRVPHDLYYQIRTSRASAPGQDGADAVMELRALDVEYVVVHGLRSQEHYRDYQNPQKFDGLLSKVWQNSGDDAVFRALFSGFAHLVHPRELPLESPGRGRMELLKPLIAAFDDPSRPRLSSTWTGTSRLVVRGVAPEGMWVTTSINASPGWEARQDGAPLAVEANSMGFVMVRPHPKPVTEIVFEYRAPLEPRAMAVLSGFTWIGSFALLRRSRHTPPPAARIPVIAGRVIST